MLMIDLFQVMVWPGNLQRLNRMKRQPGREEAREESGVLIKAALYLIIL